MEPYIKNLIDITYMSKLIPHPGSINFVIYRLGVGLIRVNNLLALCVPACRQAGVSYALIK